MRRSDSVVSSNGGLNFGGAYSWSAGDVADPAIAVRGQTIVVAWSARNGGKRDIFVMRSDDAGANMDPVWRAVNNSEGAVARHPSVTIGHLASRQT